MNTEFEVMPRGDWPVHTAMSFMFVLALIRIDQRRTRLKSDHPAVSRALGNEIGVIDDRYSSQYSIQSMCGIWYHDGA